MTQLKAIEWFFYRYDSSRQTQHIQVCTVGRRNNNQEVNKLGLNDRATNAMAATITASATNRAMVKTAYIHYTPE